MNYKEIDEKALKISQEFKKSEADLLEIIMQVDQKKVYRHFNYPSLFKYVVSRLKLSEAQAYNFINVARKSVEVPLLKEKIQQGELSVSKAKKITSVINTNNQDHWLNLAITERQKTLEKEVACAKPETAIVEKYSFQSLQSLIKEKVQFKKEIMRVKLEMGLSEELMLQFKQVQNLIAQKKKSSINLEETLKTLIEEYIKRHDPLAKAKRNNKRNTSTTSVTLTASTARVLRTVKNTTKRKPIAVSMKHQLYLKSGGQCTATLNGQRCESKSFLEIHHIKALSHGGSDDLKNLTLLCSGHHKAVHHK